MKPKLGLLLLVSVFCTIPESKCSKGCGLALASYYEWKGSNLTIIAEVLQSDLNITPDTIVSYNKQKIPSKDTVCSTGYKNQCLYLLVRVAILVVVLFKFKNLSKYLSLVYRWNLHYIPCCNC
jgi:hypothetical protein